MPLCGVDDEADKVTALRRRSDELRKTRCPYLTRCHALGSRLFGVLVRSMSAACGALCVLVVSEVGSEVLLCAFVPAVDLPAGCGVSGGGMECCDDGVAVVDV